MVVIRIPKSIKMFELIYNYNLIRKKLHSTTNLYFSGIGDKTSIINDLEALKDIIKEIDVGWKLEERETEYTKSKEYLE